MWVWHRNGRHVDRTAADGPPVYLPILKPPAWTAEVPPLKERLVLHDFGPNRKYYEISIADETLTFTGEKSPFEKRNIEAADGSLRTA